MKYTSRLEEAFEECQNCTKCKSLENCPNKVPGYAYTPIESGKIINFSYVVCKKQQEEDIKSAHQNNLELYDMPKDIKNATLKNMYKDDKARVPIVKYFKEFIDNKNIFFGSNSFEVYFEEDDFDSFAQKLETLDIKYVHGNHDDIKSILEDLKIKKVDGILLDLGVSSYQLDEKSRGFSYIGDNELDMRMDKSQELTAKIVVNTYSEDSLVNIISEYGEERFAKNIAKNICLYRIEKEIETTNELVKIIENSIPKSKQKDGHPAKRTFQAIRIEVNDELRPLYNTVKDSINCLKKGGRLCIITFHSLEDRAVKQAYLDAVRKMYLSS